MIATVNKMRKSQKEKLVMKRIRSLKGFTLIELIMVILLLAVLAAVAIPNFQDFRTEARDSAVQGELGAIRAAIAIARASIALKEDTNVPLYPTAAEIQANAFNGSHPILNALPIDKKRIFTRGDIGPASPWPENPWSLSSLSPALKNTVINCNYVDTGTGFYPGPYVSLSRGFLVSYQVGWWVYAPIHYGWCYQPNTGEFWANSARNGGALGNTENYF